MEVKKVSFYISIIFLIFLFDFVEMLDERPYFDLIFRKSLEKPEVLYDESNYPRTFPFVTFFANISYIYCMGVLFNPMAVLTTANCATEMIKDPGVKVKTVGKNTTTSQVYSIRNFLIHENFETRNTKTKIAAYNLAIAFLYKPVDTKSSYFGVLLYNLSNEVNLPKTFFTFQSQGKQNYTSKTVPEWRDLILNDGFISRDYLSVYKDRKCTDIESDFSKNDDLLCYLSEDPVSIKNEVFGGVVVTQSNKIFAIYTASDKNRHVKARVANVLHLSKNWFMKVEKNVTWSMEARALYVKSTEDYFPKTNIALKPQIENPSNELWRLKTPALQAVKQMVPSNLLSLTKNLENLKGATKKSAKFRKRLTTEPCKCKNSSLKGVKPRQDYDYSGEDEGDYEAEQDDETTTEKKTAKTKKTTKSASTKKKGGDATGTTKKTGGDTTGTTKKPGGDATTTTTTSTTTTKKTKQKTTTDIPVSEDTKCKALMSDKAYRIMAYILLVLCILKCGILAGYLIFLHSSTDSHSISITCCCDSCN